MLDKIKIDQCTITLTRNCNLRCSFCYAKKTEYIENEMIEYDNLIKIIDFCNDAKVKYIVFTGGEPLLYYNFSEILRYIKSKKSKMFPTIATNGILLSDFDYCKELIDNGLSYVDISIKGKDEKDCLKMVGQKCFSKQMNAIRNLSLLPVDFTCSMVLTWENINYFCEAVRAAHNNGARQFSFTFFIDNEKSEYKDFAYLKRNNPFELIDTFISHIDKLNSVTNDWWIEYSFPICFYTEDQLFLLKGKLASPCFIYKGNAITFDAKMNLLPCNMYIEDKMGQFGKDFSSCEDFEKITQSIPYKSKLEFLRKLPSDTCITCKYLESCYGGCPVIWKNFTFEALAKFKENYYNL